MPEEYDRGYARYAQDAPATAETFLGDTAYRLNDIKQILYGISERLSTAGFYPPPQPTSSDNAKPAESNVRHEISDQLGQIYETANTIRAQLEKLL